MAERMLDAQADLHALDAGAAPTGAELFHRFLRWARRPPVPSADA
jgi:hypothetical protein